MGPTRIKICGLTDPDDAALAVELGAWALGVILWPGSKRACDPAVAAAIGRTLHRKAEVVGVTVDQPLDEVAVLADVARLTMLQLHGDEGPAYCAELARRTGCRIIKAARVGSRADVLALKPFATDFHLLDARRDAAPGGTGETWDWRLIGAHRGGAPVIVAGGLTAANVADAIAATRPFAVDTASGTEGDVPGRKDPERLAAFIAAAQGAQVPA